MAPRVKTPTMFHVYHLAQNVQQHIHGIDLTSNPSPTRLAFKYMASATHADTPGKILQTVVLVDTGASTRFVSQQWVRQHDLPVKPTHVNWIVTLADNTHATVTGTVDITLNINGYQEPMKFLVIPMATNFDIVLGNDWALSRQAVIDFGDMAIRVQHKGRSHTLRPTGFGEHFPRTLNFPCKSGTSDFDSSTPSSFILNAAQAKRFLARRTDWDHHRAATYPRD